MFRYGWVRRVTQDSLSHAQLGAPDAERVLLPNTVRGGTHGSRSGTAFLDLWSWDWGLVETSPLCLWSRGQSGAPDTGCRLTPRVDYGGTHRSTLNAAEPGKPVSGGLTKRSLNKGQSGASDNERLHVPKTGHGGTHRSVSTWPARAAPSQGHLTLGASAHPESTMGEPIDRRSVRLHQVCGGRGRRYPPVGAPIRRGISLLSV